MLDVIRTFSHAVSGLELSPILHVCMHAFIRFMKPDPSRALPPYSMGFTSYAILSTVMRQLFHDPEAVRVWRAEVSP